MERNMAAGESGLVWEVMATAEALAERAAEVILSTVRARPEALLCLPTGATPVPTYARLAEHGRRERGVFSAIRILQLDEWGGLPVGHQATGRAFMEAQVVGPWGLRTEQLTSFLSAPPDGAAECLRIKRWLDENGPIDLCVLGLGANGHLGLNEPGPELTAHAHVATLSQSTRQHTMLTGCDTAGLYGLTLGIADILHAKQVLLLVSGAHKAAPLRELREKAITTRLPASFLRLHAHAKILCDAAAWAESLAV